MKLSKELTVHIASHLSSVRKNLSGLPSDEQKEILQSIEAHIYDALESNGGDEPSAALLDAVLAEMDPPESYGDEVPVSGKNRRRLWLLLIPALILIVAVMAGISKHSVKNADPAGRWESVDFVDSIDQFSPLTKNRAGDLYLKAITFLPNGKTDRPYWTWTNGILHHSGDNTDAKLLIKKISGENYLFLEWMSGDVLSSGIPPKYYVLKQTNPN